MDEWVRLVGLDLSTDNSRCGVAALDIAMDGSTASLLTEVDLEDEGAFGDADRTSEEWLLNLLNWAPKGRMVLIGIDSPFGWPAAFVQSVSAWSAGEGWDPGSGRSPVADMRYRRTDQFVRERGRAAQARDKAARRKQRAWPAGISVSSDKLSATARRCAALLTNQGWSSADHRTGRVGPVCEVYPAAALAEWGLPSKGYKTGEGAEGMRTEIVKGLATSLTSSGSGAGEALGKALGESRVAELGSPFIQGRHADDALDGLVCALVAWAWSVGCTHPVGPSEDSKVVDGEGWIQHPREELEHIATLMPTGRINFS